MFIFSNDSKEKRPESTNPEYKGILGNMLRHLIWNVDAKAMPAIENAVNRLYPLVEDIPTQEATQLQHIAEPTVTGPTVLKLVSSTPEVGNSNFPAPDETSSKQDLDLVAVRRDVEDAYGEAA